MKVTSEMLWFSTPLDLSAVTNVFDRRCQMVPGTPPPQPSQSSDASTATEDSHLPAFIPTFLCGVSTAVDLRSKRERWGGGVVDDERKEIPGLHGDPPDSTACPAPGRRNEINMLEARADYSSLGPPSHLLDRESQSLTVPSSLAVAQRRPEDENPDASNRQHEIAA